MLCPFLQTRSPRATETDGRHIRRNTTYSGRLRLIQLIPEAKQAFYEDKLTVAHAFEIARLQPNDQRRALQECFPRYRNAAAILKDKKAEATTVRELGLSGESILT